ncbi:flagellar hook-length control protein FliK [Bacillaceae bacterium SIJ1]|uniref:flagellar hook-length control protein FliK n=1 Tax=Litoribacterium kuwaitense TaxID=1398745 RepID=UPI0013ED5F10|nr:flagellar hook-length control protein FliK [Litoribacterium kuwaitense]NGP44142.1 flagellar hook-length control protein FliK [Litoribacterium kuwaitense]
MLQQLMDMLSTTMQRPPQPLMLTEGQVLRGRVLEVKAETKTAVVLLAGKRVDAVLNTPVKPQQSYVFQVYKNEGEGPPIGLRTLPDAQLPLQTQTQTQATNQRTSLATAALPDWLAQAVGGKAALSKTEVAEWQSLFRQFGKTPENITMLQTMARFSLPPSEPLFRSLTQWVHSETDQTTAAKAYRLLHSLQLAEPTQTTNTLKQALELLLPLTAKEGGLNDRIALLRSWSSFVNVQENTKERPSIQQLLQSFASEQGNTPAAKEAEDLLHKLQLFSHLSKEREGTGQTFFLHFSDNQGDQVVQYQGQHTNEGELDADFCRLFFCLRLDVLGEVLLDVRVQNRAVSIEFIHEDEKVSHVLHETSSQLREKLSALDYTLSYIEQKVPTVDDDLSWVESFQVPVEEGREWRI